MTEVIVGGKPSNVHETFWQRTLRAFEDKPVRLKSRRGNEVTGKLHDLTAGSAGLLMADGVDRLIQYEDILSCEVSEA